MPGVFKTFLVNYYTDKLLNTHKNIFLFLDVYYNQLLLFDQGTGMLSLKLGVKIS